MLSQETEAKILALAYLSNPKYEDVDLALFYEKYRETAKDFEKILDSWKPLNRP